VSRGSKVDRTGAGQWLVWCAVSVGEIVPLLLYTGAEKAGGRELEPEVECGTLVHLCGRSGGIVVVVTDYTSG
jgi:hypothetical protein